MQSPAAAAFVRSAGDAPIALRRSRREEDAAILRALNRVPAIFPASELTAAERRERYLNLCVVPPPDDAPAPMETVTPFRVPLPGRPN